MKTLLIQAAFAFAATTALAQNVGGEYRVQGTNLDGSPYSGEAEIVPTSDTTCEIYWTTAGTTSSGICARNGDSFSAAYELQGEIGLVIYKIARDGSMEGLWTLAGQSGNGTERLIPR